MINFLLTSEGQTQNPLGSWISIIIIVAFVVILFYTNHRSKKKNEKEYNDMMESLAVGDEVTTIGGIIGKIVSIKGETFVLETTKDRTKIRFLKGAIRSVDVKASDIAAAVIDGKADENANVDATEQSAESSNDLAKEDKN